MSDTGNVTDILKRRPSENVIWGEMLGLAAKTENEELSGTSKVLGCSIAGTRARSRTSRCRRLRIGCRKVQASKLWSPSGPNGGESNTTAIHNEHFVG